MYQIISSPQADASVNDITIEALSEYDNIRLNISYNNSIRNQSSQTHENWLLIRIESVTTRTCV